MQKLSLIRNDPWLEPFSQRINDRHLQAIRKEQELTRNIPTLKEFASGHLYFGLHRKPDSWIFREWAPNAEKIFLVGDFSNWEERPENLLEKKDNGTWEIMLSSDRLHHENTDKVYRQILQVLPLHF